MGTHGQTNSSQEHARFPENLGDLPDNFEEALVQVMEELLKAINQIDHRIKRDDEALRSPHGYYPLINRISQLRSMLKERE